MSSTFSRVLLAGITLTAMITMSGCGIAISLPNQSVDLISEIDVPSIDVPLDQIPDEWLDYLEGQDYEQSDSFCDLPNLGDIQSEAANSIPPFLARLIRIESVEVTSIDFVAKEGDFGSMTKLQTILTIGNTQYEFLEENPAGFGEEVVLTPEPALDLANVIGDDRIDCIEYYVQVKGSLPEDDLVFKVVLNFDVQLRLRLF